MKRRDLFKGLAGLLAATVAAPLAKLLPAPKPARPKLTINRIWPYQEWYASKDLSLSIDDFSQRYIIPAIRKMAAEDEAFLTGDRWEA